MCRRISLSLIVRLLLITALSVNIRAQAIYGSIFGTVTDPQGAVVANATVTITGLTKNVTTTAKTNESGNYGRNSLHGPLFFQTDLSVFKNFKITESSNLEFRAEGVNISIKWTWVCLTPVWTVTLGQQVRYSAWLGARRCVNSNSP